MAPALLLATLATSLTLASQPATPQPTTAPTTNQSAATAPDLSALLTRLGNDNFATRQAAQQDLDRISPQFRATLLKLADQTKDADVRSRLLLRVQQIDDELVINPPPISLHIKDADASALSAALSREMGIPLVADTSLLDPPPQPQPPAIFTLDAENQPYWDVYAKLSQQHFLRLTPPGEPLFSPLFHRLHNYQLFGPFVVFQAATGYSNSIDLQAAHGTTQPAPRFNAEIIVAADPRVRLAGPVPPFVDALVDDTGTKLWQRPAAPVNYSVSANRWGEDVPLPLTLKHGQQLFAVGAARVTLQVTETRREIPDVTADLTQSFQLGSLGCTISGAGPLQPGDGPRFTVTVRNLDADSTHVVTCLLWDSTGRSMQGPGTPSTTSISAGRGVGFPFTGTGKPPYALTVSTPTKTKEFSFAFRLPLITE